MRRGKSIGRGEMGVLRDQRKEKKKMKRKCKYQGFIQDSFLLASPALYLNIASRSRSMSGLIGGALIGTYLCEGGDCSERGTKRDRKQRENYLPPSSCLNLYPSAPHRTSFSNLIFVFGLPSAIRNLVGGIQLVNGCEVWWVSRLVEESDTCSKKR